MSMDEFMEISAVIDDMDEVDNARFKYIGDVVGHALGLKKAIG